MDVTRHAVIVICLTITCTEVPPAQTVPVVQQTPTTRRSQRVQMPPLDVRSPNGQVTLTFLPNPERVTFTVALGNTPVIEPSGRWRSVARSSTTRVSRE